MSWRKGEASGFLMFDHDIQVIQSFFNYDSTREFLRRFKLLKEYPKVINKDNFIKLNCRSRVIEHIAIKRIIIDNQLDIDCISIPLKSRFDDLSNGLYPELQDHDLKSATPSLHADFTPLIAIEKPLVCCSDEEIRQHVINKLPYRIKDNKNETRSIMAKRASLTKSLKRRKNRGLAIIANSLYYVGGQTSNKYVSSAQRNAKKWRDASNRTWKVKSSSFGKKELGSNQLNILKSKNKKVAETLCIAQGLKRYCVKEGWIYASITVTAPPQNHPNPSVGKSSWNQSMPDETARLLIDKWKSLQASLNNKKISIAGLRTAETHADSCPHFNFLVYFPECHQKQVLMAFRKAFGRSKKLCLINDNSSISDEKFFWYATKHVPGMRAETDESLRQQTCLSNYGIRQMQWFGVPSMQLWRALMSSKEMLNEPSIQSLWQTVQEKKYDDFIESMGGLDIQNKQRPFYIVSRKQLSMDDEPEFGICNRVTGIEYYFNKQTKHEDSDGSVRNDASQNHSKVDSISFMPVQQPSNISLESQIKTVVAKSYLDINDKLSNMSSFLLSPIAVNTSLANGSGFHICHPRLLNKIIVNINIPSKRIFDLRKSSFDKTNKLVNKKLIFVYLKRNLDMSGSLRHTSINWDFRPP